MHQRFMDEAIKEAQISLSEGGIPIGAVLVKDDEVISRGHNRLIQDNSVILHGEMDAIENAKGLDYDDYRKCTLYTTLSPCPMFWSRAPIQYPKGGHRRQHNIDGC